MRNDELNRSRCIIFIIHHSAFITSLIRSILSIPVNFSSATFNLHTEANSVVQRFPTLLLALALILVPVFAQQPSTQSAQQQASRKSAEPPSTPALPPPRVHVEEYRERASRIIGAALTDDTAYRRLAWLTDRIGNRLSGSESLGPALEWAASEMRRDRLDDVHTEKGMVPPWGRGGESPGLGEPGRRNP